ncbi:unnamed protein product [[Candida] boidinii]|nr:unnamed protein product [[Candida] boidinii]
MVKARAKRKTKAKYKKLAEKENDNAASVLESGNEIEGGLEDEGDDIAVIIEEDEFDDLKQYNILLYLWFPIYQQLLLE